MCIPTPIKTLTTHPACVVATTHSDNKQPATLTTMERQSNYSAMNFRKIDSASLNAHASFVNFLTDEQMIPYYAKLWCSYTANRYHCHILKSWKTWKKVYTSTFQKCYHTTLKFVTNPSQQSIYFHSSLDEQNFFSTRAFRDIT